MVDSATIQALLFCGGVMVGILLVLACQAIICYCKKKPGLNYFLLFIIPYNFVQLKSNVEMFHKRDLILKLT